MQCTHTIFHSQDGRCCCCRGPLSAQLNIKYAFNHISAGHQIIPHETKVNHLEIYGPASHEERTKPSQIEIKRNETSRIEATRANQYARRICFIKSIIGSTVLTHRNRGSRGPGDLYYDTQTIRHLWSTL